MSSVHVSVLPREIIDSLQPQPGQTLVDGTLGGGGHTRLLLERIAPGGQVLALDRDPAAIARAETVFRGQPLRLCQANFCELPAVLPEIGLSHVQGIVLDLGLSSDQLADAARGFSFLSDGPLDLRFDPSQGRTAADLVNHLPEADLANLIYRYGEERFSRRIAREIVAARREAPLTTSGQLAQLVRRCVPRNDRIDPATRTFQALRIAVNEELKSLETALQVLPNCLSPGGRLAIISFHSLEDRLVKHAFRDDERLENLTRKPLLPSAAEIAANPRSRSAKLRVAERRADR